MCIKSILQENPLRDMFISCLSPGGVRGTPRRRRNWPTRTKRTPSAVYTALKINQLTFKYCKATPLKFSGRRGWVNNVWKISFKFELTENDINIRQRTSWKIQGINRIPNIPYCGDCARTTWSGVNTLLMSPTLMALVDKLTPPASH